MKHHYSFINRMILNGEYDWERVVEFLFDKYSTDLLYLAKTILRDPDTAEDVVQETLITAATKIHQYQPGTNLKSWLYTIAVNRCRRYYRKLNARYRLVAVLKNVLPNDQKFSSPEGTIIQNEINDQLWQVVNRLDERHRLQIVLRYLHSLSCREISQILRVNEGTVSSRLHYGVQKLQSLLQRGNIQIGREENGRSR